MASFVMPCAFRFWIVASAITPLSGTQRNTQGLLALVIAVVAAPSTSRGSWARAMIGTAATVESLKNPPRIATGFGLAASNFSTAVTPPLDVPWLS